MVLFICQSMSEFVKNPMKVFLVKMNNYTHSGSFLFLSIVRLNSIVEYTFRWRVNIEIVTVKRNRIEGLNNISFDSHDNCSRTIEK